MREWGKGNRKVGQVVILREQDKSNFGYSLSIGIVPAPKVDSLLLTVAHSGDCFWDYRLIESWWNGMTSEQRDAIENSSSTMFEHSLRHAVEIGRGITPPKEQP